MGEWMIVNFPLTRLALLATLSPRGEEGADIATVPPLPSGERVAAKRPGVGGVMGSAAL